MHIYRYVTNYRSNDKCSFSQHQKKRAILFVLSFLCFGALFLTNCKKEKDPVSPQLSFINDSGLIFQDTAMKAGSSFNFGLTAEMGDHTLTNLYIARYFEGGMEVMVDSGIHNETFTYYGMLNKGVYDTELWKFRVKDLAGQWAEVSFTLSNLPGSNYDPVVSVSSIIMGAQQCSTNGSFLDVKNSVVYFQDEAFLIQDSIELLYYYDPAGDANTISSPNANIDVSIYTGPTSLPFWTVKNETRFVETTISPAQFDAVVNDSLPIAIFDQLNAKRKAKNLLSGEVYSFKTARGKFGLFKVLNVVGAETGTVECAIKIQP